MKPSVSMFSKTIGIFLTLAILGSLFQWRASQNLGTQNYYNSNFFVFWLSGKLFLEGQSPYNADHWSDGHAQYGNVVPREPTFLYPLPLVVFLIPFGLLPVENAYYLWQWTSQIAIAVTVYFLLKRWNSQAHNRLFVPIMIFLTFYGPIYLTLQIGALGPLTLLFVFTALQFLDKDHHILSGIFLSLTMLKPSQGLTILLLLGLVFLLRQQWRVILGLLIGGLILLIMGLLIEPDWVSVFRQSSEAAFDRRLGVQSTVWSFAYLVCSGNSNCSGLLGLTGMLLLLGGTAFYLWRNHIAMSNWQIFNLVLPIAFLSTLYLWSYDQILYLFPIIWIVGKMVEKTKSYVSAIIFLILLDAISFYALIQQALTDKDLWSLGTTLLVLLFLVIAWRMKQKPAIDKATAPV